MDLKVFHQVFSDKVSFCHWVNVFNKEKVALPKLLYVAAHGTEGRISGLKKDINSTTMVTALKKARNIKYVHFGSCLYGSERNLETLLQKAKHLSWAAGYDKSVDWIDSTLFDVMLWGRIVCRDADTKGQKSHTLAQKFMSAIPGLARDLGFRFQYRYGKTCRNASTNSNAEV
jgi:hypothetical protein